MSPALWSISLLPHLFIFLLHCNPSYSCPLSLNNQLAITTNRSLAELSLTVPLFRPLIKILENGLNFDDHAASSGSLNRGQSLNTTSTDLKALANELEQLADKWDGVLEANRKANITLTSGLNGTTSTTPENDDSDSEIDEFDGEIDPKESRIAKRRRFKKRRRRPIKVVSKVKNVASTIIATTTYLNLWAAIAASRPRDCPRHLSRQYLNAINSATKFILTSFDERQPHLLPIATPFWSFLALRPPAGGTKMTNVSSLRLSVNQNAFALKHLAIGLTTMLDEWRGHFSANQTDRLNKITKITLNELGRQNTILLPITDALLPALHFPPTKDLTDIEMIINGTQNYINSLAETLNDLTNEWDQATERYLETELKCTTGDTEIPPIIAINRLTRSTLTTFGQSKPNLKPLTNSLQLGLVFDILTGRGIGPFNAERTVRASAIELKQLASGLINLTTEWLEISEEFEAGQC